MLRTILSRAPTHLRFGRHSSPSAATRYLFSSQSKEEGTDATEPSPENSNGQSADATPKEAEPLTTEQQLTKKLEEKEQELADLNDRTLRILAEMENVRTIARRDVENAKRYSIAPFAEGLLSVADNLGLALKAVPEEALEENQQLKGLFVGVGATETELLKVFSQHGITRFGSVGDKFDPNKYQAMFEAPIEGTEPGTVIDVTKLGYTIGDRLLRPAEVGVCKAP